MVGDEALGDAGAGGDVAGAGRLVAVLHERVAGRFDDPLTGLFTPLGAKHATSLAGHLTSERIRGCVLPLFEGQVNEERA